MVVSGDDLALGQELVAGTGPVTAGHQQDTGQQRDRAEEISDHAMPLRRGEGTSADPATTDTYTSRVFDWGTIGQPTLGQPDKASLYRKPSLRTILQR